MQQPKREMQEPYAVTWVADGKLELNWNTHDGRGSFPDRQRGRGAGRDLKDEKEEEMNPPAGSKSPGSTQSWKAKCDLEAIDSLQEQRASLTHSHRQNGE